MASGQRSAAGRIGGSGRGIAGGEVVHGEAEDGGEQFQLEVGNDALAGLDPADGHLAELETMELHFNGQLLLGEAVGGTPLAYALAADVALLSVGV